MRGMISGGWEYIRAAYIVSAVILGAYSLFVIARYRRALRVAGEESRDPNE